MNKLEIALAISLGVAISAILLNEVFFGEEDDDDDAKR